MTGRGLVLASGAAIGTNGNNESVSVTLTCVGEGNVLLVRSHRTGRWPAAGVTAVNNPQ